MSSPAADLEEEGYMKKKITIILGCIVAFLIIIAIIPTPSEPELPQSEPKLPSEPASTGIAEITIVDYHIDVNNVGIDKLHPDPSIVLKNIGEIPVKITKIVISSDGEEVKGSSFATLEVGEEREFSGYYDEIDKDIGVRQIDAAIKVFGYVGEWNVEDERVLAEKSVVIPIPTVEIGDTIPEIESGHNLSLTLLSWNESSIVVNGPYISGYYTFTAKPGMKFIIITYKFQNNWIREQYTPYINEGEIATDKGYIYSVWDPIGGIHTEEYKPRKSTRQEIKNLIGDSGGFEDLLPEESTVGCVVFEIPENQNPIEADIAYVLPLIVF